MTLLVQRSQHEDAGSVRHIPPVVRAPAAPPRRADASLAVDNRGQGRSLALCSVAVARAACATRRSSSPPGLGTNRRTCHSHAEKDPVATLDSPLQVACALALNTKAEDAKRQRWAPRRAVGYVSGRVAGRVGWRRRSGGTCRPASALLRAGRVQPPSWPRMGPLGSAPLHCGCSWLAHDHGRVRIRQVAGFGDWWRHS